MMALSLLTLTVLLIIQCITGEIADYTLLLPGFSSCKFEGHSYKIGERFHPLTMISGKEYEELCIDCTCNPTTVVQCEKIKCPTLNCKNPVRLTGECCDRCPGENLSGIELQQWHSIPRDCTLDGVVYEHGTTFHPPSSLHSHTHHIYCTVYTCNNGTLSYSDASSMCPPIMACDESQAFHVNGSCCKVCPKVVLEKGECKDELGNRRMANETWHFYSSVYRKTLTCINCTCKGSESYTCSRNPCPPVPACTKNDKPEDIVICCPKCSNKPVEPPNNQPDINQTSTEVPTIIECPHSHKVFLCNATSMAIENVKNQSVIKYVWLPNDIKQAYQYSTSEFQKLSCSNKQNYQGGTMERRVNGLKNKESKRLKILNCRKDCAQLVVRMLRPTKDC